jgi:hypothetical protein
MAYEDTDPTTLAIEDVILSGTPNYPYSNRLRQEFLRFILTGTNPPTAARALITTATLFEPGALFSGYFADDVTDVQFSTKRRLIDVDTDLSPRYGLIRPAINELRTAGIDPVVERLWLDNFRSDNALYRVAVAAGICLTAAFAQDGFIVEV